MGEEVPYVPGDSSAPEGLYRAVLIKPPQVGGFKNVAEVVMDTDASAAVTKTSRELELEAAAANGNGGDMHGTGGSDDDEENKRRRNPTWLTKQISFAIRGEGRWPWSEEELKGGLSWEGALRAMARGS
jgi:hypothetical protein